VISDQQDHIEDITEDHIKEMAENTKMVQEDITEDITEDLIKEVRRMKSQLKRYLKANHLLRKFPTDQELFKALSQLQLQLQLAQKLQFLSLDK
jgi:DNA-binding transcriptional regulator GbsR (MarR family)